MPKSAFSEWKSANFPGQVIPKFVTAPAAKIFKRSPEEALAYIKKHLENPGPPITGNFSGPIECQLVSGPRVEDRSLASLSKRIQEIVFSMTVDERASWKPNDCQSMSQHLDFYSRTGLRSSLNDKEAQWLSGHVQEMNAVFKNAFNTFDGVLTKVANRNKKREAKLDRRNSWLVKQGKKPVEFIPDVATTEEGRLKDPPAPNPTIFGCANIAPVLASILPDGRPLDPKGVIPHVSRTERLDIPPGTPGYVPEWQRSEGIKVSPITGRSFHCHGLRKGRVLKHRAKGSLLQEDPGRIPILLQVGGDNFEVDGRGILDYLCYRAHLPVEDPRHLPNFKRKELTYEGLLNYVTTGYQLRKNTCVFGFREQYKTVRKCKTIEFWKRKTIDSYLSLGPVACIQADLGVNCPIAFGMSVVNRLPDGSLAEQNVPVPSNVREWVSSVKVDVIRLQKAHDKIEQDLERDAIASLSDAEQAEIHAISQDQGEQCKDMICRTFGLDKDRIPWDNLPTWTYLSDIIGDDSRVCHPSGDKKSNLALSKEFRPKLSEETAKRKRLKVEELKRGSSAYRKLSISIDELAQKTINYIRRAALAQTGLTRICWAIEDLDVKGKFFDGKGKRSPGWEGFFTRKTEGRWVMIKAFHRNISSLSVHRGDLVIEVDPAGTSCKCPECGHWDADNRHGEEFRCVKCQHAAHTDWDVAPTNIGRAMVSGRRLPYCACRERLNGANPSRSPRTRKGPKSLVMSSCMVRLDVDDAAEE